MFETAAVASLTVQVNHLLPRKGVISPEPFPFPGYDLSWEKNRELQDNCSLLVLAIIIPNPKGPRKLAKNPGIPPPGGQREMAVL